MPNQDSVTTWLHQLQNGRSSAATDLWYRYYERLIRVAAQKLRAAPRRVADEDDVVLAAFDSFFRGVQQGRFPKLEDRDDLWQVLVMLTARKAVNQRKYYNRQKRGDGQVRGDSVFLRNGNCRAGIHEIIDDGPSPEFVQELTDTCAHLLDILGDETLRSVAIAKMEGYSNEEIAKKMDVKTRTVERKLQSIRQIWSAAEFVGT